MSMLLPVWHRMAKHRSLSASVAFSESMEKNATTQVLGPGADEDFERKVAECEVDLWEIKSAQVFEQFVTSATVMDLVAHWSVHLKEKLLKISQKVTIVLQPVSGENLWKKDLPVDASLDDVLAKAAETLKIPKGVTFMTQLTAFHEEKGYLQNQLRCGWVKKGQSSSAQKPR